MKRFCRPAGAGGHRSAHPRRFLVARFGPPRLAGLLCVAPFMCRSGREITLAQDLPGEVRSSHGGKPAFFQCGVQSFTFRLKTKLLEESDAESLLPAHLAVFPWAPQRGWAPASHPALSIAPAAEDLRSLATAMLKAPLHTFGRASCMKHSLHPTSLSTKWRDAPKCAARLAGDRGRGSTGLRPHRTLKESAATWAFPLRCARSPSMTEEDKGAFPLPPVRGARYFSRFSHLMSTIKG
ncbi:uncharacterized protein LOC129399572 [Sorex araneus]|uniref:uncharacterized protein LOC129399572 n=1 Tax=Sorex araneus TaxID=42254 RepID=UPI0024339544|nr:uncharacterized protein LOC129399572 [Sorex araneus]